MKPEYLLYFLVFTSILFPFAQWITRSANDTSKFNWVEAFKLGVILSYFLTLCLVLFWATHLWIQQFK